MRVWRSPGPTESQTPFACSAVNLTTPSAVSKRLEDIGGLRLTTSGLDIYAESKMLLNLWTDELQERLAAHASTKRECLRSFKLSWPEQHSIHQPYAADILVNCTHPGMIASDIQRKTDKSTFLAVLIYFIVYVAGATADVGALSALFCATSDAAAAHPGKMWSPGPSVQLSVPSKYDRTLCRPAFDAINEAIKSKGGAGFHLPVPA